MACQLELIDKAFKFTSDYMHEAKSISISNIRMKSTGQEDAETSIYTDKGDLGSALMDKGLARPISIKAEEPWC